MSLKTFDQLCDYFRQTQLLNSINALLQWDQETKMPAAGGEFRAQQITLMAGEIHKRNTDPVVGQWLAELTDSELARDPHSDSGATIRELKHQYLKQSKLPLELVQRTAKACAVGQTKWVDARKQNDFKQLAPNLKEIFALKREQAQAIGGGDCLYDVLLDDYEPGARTNQVAQALGELKNQLVPLIEAVADAPDVDSAVVRRNYSVSQQEAFVKQASTAIGFDYERGRLDIAHHPFCTELGPDDCRITTRYDESFFNPAFFGTLHEAGHGLYEQGLRREQYGLPPGTYCSLGLHESQSRLWENLVGRSRGFWNHFYPPAQKHFCEALGDVSIEAFHMAINEVKPSLIRVEADEATYNLHIIIRFELEQALLEEDLAIDDLPQAWNDMYQQYLGIRPQTDAEGVLQDIHWSAGLIGYFSTYSLGNIYASQLFEQAQRDVGDLESQFAEGEFSPLLHWLREKIHKAGFRWRANELMRNVAGSAIDHAPIVRHLKSKMHNVYSLA